MLALRPSRREINWTQLRFQASALIGGAALHKDTRLGTDKRRSCRGRRWADSSLETLGLAGTSLAVVCVGSLSCKNAVLHEPLHVAIETFLPAQPPPSGPESRYLIQRYADPSLPPQYPEKDLIKLRSFR